MHRIHEQEYRVNRETIDSRTGRITRDSDGAILRVEIPFDQTRYKVLRTQMERHDINHPGEPNLIWTLACADSAAERGRKMVVDTSSD